MDESAIDTLKTTAVGFTGSNMVWLDVIPPIVSIVGGIVTIGYMLIKTRNEYFYGKKNREGSR